jgi:hypothetical protein
MSIVSYRGSKLQPAPLIEINEVFQKTPNGEVLGKTYTINVIGKIVSYKGSPTSSGTFNTGVGYLADENVADNARLGAILRKQEAIQELFGVEGGSFEVQSLDGSPPLRCNPRINSISFPAGQWYTQCDYNITLEADEIFPLDTPNSGLELISDATETWSLDTEESAEDENLPRIYRLTHNVSAVGKRIFNSIGVVDRQPWERARDYVIARLGYDASQILSSGINNLPTYYGGFNHIRNENKDELGGSFTVTETWIITSGSSLEDFSVETSKAIDTGLTRVSINGNITGLEERNSTMGLTTHKYTNALSKFSIASGLAFSRAQTYSGYSLNIQPISERIGRNPVTGTISYGYEYDNRPSNIVSGALSEAISITDNLDTQTIAIIPVLGRRAGPVLQDLGTSSQITRQLDIQVVMPFATFGDNSQSSIQSALFGQRPTNQLSGIINAADPANNGFSQSYIQSNVENWSPKDGRYSRNITWIMEL